MQKLLIITMLMLPLAVNSQIASQIVYPMFTSVDDRANGMGRLGITSAKGSDAIFSNPALLATQKATHITVGGRARGHLIDDEAKNTSVQVNSNTYEAVGFPHAKLTKLGVGMPVELTGSNARLGVGLGYFTPIDQGLTVIEKESIILSSNNSERTTKLKGGLSVLSPAVSLGIKDMIFVGMSINTAIFSSFTLDTEDDITGVSPSNTTTETFYETAGTFVTFGLAGKPLSNLLVSIRHTPGFNFEFEEGETEVNNDGARTRTELNDGKMEIPGVFAAGAEYQFSPALALALGYQNRKLSDFEIGNVNQDYEDGFALSLGMEILAGEMALRMGTFMESQPMRDVDNTSAYVHDLPKPAYGGTFGIGLPLGAIDLDIGLEYAYITRQETSIIPGSVPAGSRDYDYVEQHVRLNMGMTYNLDFVPSMKLPKVQGKSGSGSTPVEDEGPVFDAPVDLDEGSGMDDDPVDLE